jgi:DNA-binding MarR family transcriptional regulator
VAQGSLSRLSHAITRLERSGWVERRSCTDNGGRRIEARLTDAGLAKLEEIAPGHVREARRLVVDVLTPEQLVALGDAARAITAATTAGATEACRQVTDC